MASRRIKTEWAARSLLIVVLIGSTLAVYLPYSRSHPESVEIHGTMPEMEGWSPDIISARVGEPLTLRLTSDDVVHGFVVGKTDWPAIEIQPGEMTEITLTFDQPGTYTFYCTRWCGPNHWRMRGKIEVTGEQKSQPTSEQPLYMKLGIDIDSPHQVAVIFESKPSGFRGIGSGINVPAEFLSQDYYRGHGPYQVWLDLKAESFTSGLSDEAVWDLVAVIWEMNSNPDSLESGEVLYTQNCAACHGENGAGDGVFSKYYSDLSAQFDDSNNIQSPVDFTDPSLMMGASPALLHGKILRGGMGTGMPYWGPIFTDEQIWALVDFLWTFQFQISIKDQ